jgi:hypothetical protein
MMCPQRAHAPVVATPAVVTPPFVATQAEKTPEEPRTWQWDALATQAEKPQEEIAVRKTHTNAASGSKYRVRALNRSGIRTSRPTTFL